MGTITTEEVTVRFYNIERCGYYKHAEGETKHELMNVAELFDNLKDWISGKTLEQTKTSSALPRNSTLQVYCLGVEKSNNDNFLVTTWNEIASSEGKIASIGRIKKIGTITKPPIVTLL